MVADDPCRVGRSHVDDIGRLAVGEVLFRPSQRGFQQASSRRPTAPPCSASSQPCSAIASRSSILTGSVTCGNVQRIAIAVNDFISLRHLFLEARIGRREPVTAIRSIDQEQRFTLARLQAINDLFWRHHPERVSEFCGL